jgi:lysophospholipase L1-like esterase
MRFSGFAQRAAAGVAVLMAMGCAGGGRMTESGGGTRYLALGDSYTIGEGVAPAERWPVQLAGLLRERGVEVGDPLIIARTGWTTDELDAGIDAVDPQPPFALVTLLIGVNNQYRGRPADEYRVQFRALLARAVHFAGDDAARVVVVSIPDWGVTPFAAGRDRGQIAAEIDAFNAIGRDEAQKAGAAFVDITPESRRDADPTFLAADGLHPSGKMYTEWARLALAPALAAATHGR